jgi:hypothetical protein
MTNTIMILNKPVIHYKILAAGRNEPKSVFEFAANFIRKNDAVCVGIFPKHKPTMLEESLGYFEQAMKKSNRALPK